jgi:RNA polymerase sigma-70 factor (ECF subfamily)
MDIFIPPAHSIAMDQADSPDIQASLAGDGEAYGRLVRRHQADVARHMWRFTRDRRQLEELVHEVFVQAYFSLRTFRGDAPFAHWLGRIATRTGYRFWKKRRRAAREMSLQDWDSLAERRPGDNEVPAREAAELLHRLLAQLRPRDRLVLTLLHLEGLSVAAAAERTGWSKIMVKVQASRARKKLRALLERQGMGDKLGL